MKFFFKNVKSKEGWTNPLIFDSLVDGVVRTDQYELTAKQVNLPC